ncbi:MAG: hypothetical protein LW636_04205 [Planctomycetaceae bacterium]|nr:hypothetical protein [Planctomycetaceae bacterium]
MLQPAPSEVEPHRRHFGPGPCRCVRVGEFEQLAPYEVLPQNSQREESPECSCLRWGLFEQLAPYEVELQ